MGGSSIIYCKESKQFGLVTEVDSVIDNMLLAAIKTKEDDIIKLIDYITQNDNKIYVILKI